MFSCLSAQFPRPHSRLPRPYSIRDRILPAPSPLPAPRLPPPAPSSLPSLLRASACSAPHVRRRSQVRLATLLNSNLKQHKKVWLCNLFGAQSNFAHGEANTNQADGYDSKKASRWLGGETRSTDALSGSWVRIVVASSIDRRTERVRIFEFKQFSIICLVLRINGADKFELVLGGPSAFKFFVICNDRCDDDSSDEDVW